MFVVPVFANIAEEDMPKVAERNFRSKLRKWNIAAVVIQSISFIALLILSVVFRDKARLVNLWVETDRGSSIQTLAAYPLYSTLLPFPIITALFHVLALCKVDNYYANVLLRGTNRLRWIEYSITNGLMTFSLCTLAGAGGVVLLVGNILANFLMQYFGYLHEKLTHDTEPSKRTLSYIGFGFLPWLQNWVTILTYYGLNVVDTKVSEHLAILGSFLLSLLFVYPLLAIYGREHNMRNFFVLERTYIILSLTAKLYLDWIIVIGTVANF